MDGILNAWQESLGDPRVSSEQAAEEFFDIFEGTGLEEIALQLLRQTLPVAAEQVLQKLAARGQQ